LRDLLPDLVLEEFGVLEGVLVENEKVGETREGEVDDISEEPMRDLSEGCPNYFRERRVPCDQKERKQ